MTIDVWVQLMPAGYTKAAGILEGAKNWMAAHNAAIMAVVLLVLGVKLIGDAIGVLSS